MYYLKNIISIVLLTYWLSGCTESYSSGEQIYKNKCAQCHLEDGTGLGKLIPPLAGSDYLATHFEDLPCIILFGLHDSILVDGQLYSEPMPPIPDISPEEMTNLINFLSKKFLQKKNYIPKDTIEKWQRNCTNSKR